MSKVNIENSYPPTDLVSVKENLDLSKLTLEELKHPKNHKEAIAFSIETTKRELAVIRIPQPRYSQKSMSCVNNLYFSWDGWMSKKVLVPKSAKNAIQSQIENWKNDGFILKTWQVKNDMIQILFKVEPEVSPTLFTQRVKGRLDYAFRKLASPVKFSRKVGFRAIGDNTRIIVNNYIKKQVEKSDYIDLRYKDTLENYTLFKEHDDLSKPYIKSHGRYWFNIHLVLVIKDRKIPITKDETMEVIKNFIFKIAKKKKCNIGHFSIMPDHIHISLKGNPELSPCDIGLSFLNNLSYVLMKYLGINFKLWSDEFYVGTFSEYSIKQI